MRKNKIPEVIKHEGIVEEVSNNSVFVKITSGSACSGCHAEGFCNISGKEDKTIYIAGKYNVAKGDVITVLMEQSMGFKAVFLSYILPLLVMVICLVTLVSMSITELVAGLLSIGILMPYFFILYLFKDKINKSFTFTLKT